MERVLRNFQRQLRRCMKSMDALLVGYSLHLPAIFHCTWEYYSVEMVILYSSPIIQTLDFLLIFLSFLFRPEGCWEHGKFSLGCITERKTTIPKNDKEGYSKHRYIVTSGILYDALLSYRIVLSFKLPFPFISDRIVCMPHLYTWTRTHARWHGFALHVLTCIFLIFIRPQIWYNSWVRRAAHWTWINVKLQGSSERQVSLPQR